MAEPKGGLAYIPGEDPSAIAANKAYQDALERLNKSLEARQNRMFDPTMLALAEGFLTPGRTGSFGEALGVASGKMRAAEEAEGKQEMEIAQAKLGLAERGIALEQQRQRERQFREALGGAPAGAPGGMPTGAPAGGQPPSEEPSQRPEDRLAQAVSDTPPAVQGMVGIQVFPPTQNLVTSRSLLMQRYREGKMSLGDALAEAAKLENDRYVFRDNSVLDKLTGRMFFSPTGGTQRIMTSKGPMELPTDLIRLGRPELIEQYIKNLPSTAELEGRQAGARATAEQEVSTERVPRELPGPSGIQTYRIPPRDARMIDELIRVHGINSEVVRLAAAPFTGMTTKPAGAVAESAGVVPGAAPGAGGVRLGVPSQQQLELDQEAAKLTTKNRVEFNEAQRNKIIEASDDANEAMRRAAIFRQYADAPDANAIFGILSNDKLMSAAARLVEQGIGVTTPGGRFAVGIPEVQTIIRNLGLNPDQQAKAQVAFQLMVESQIKMSQYAKGAVSNYEQQLFAQSGINKEDIPGSIRMKSDMITLRGQFDKDVARKFEDSNQDVRTFKRSEWYQNRLKQYDEDLMKVASGNRLKVPGSPAPQVPGAQPRMRYNPSTGQWSE